MSESKPTKIFKYPGDRRMCQDGLVRAAVYGQRILTGEEIAEEIETMAQRGEYAINRGADTHKKNLIAHVVYFLFRRQCLEDYVNEEGDFLLNNQRLTNIREHEIVARRFRDGDPS